MNILRPNVKTVFSGKAKSKIMNIQQVIIKKKSRVIGVVKSVCSVAMIPLWFVKIFHGVGYLPNGAGEILKVDFYHSMFENISDIGHAYLAYVSLFLIALSIAFSVAEIAVKNRKEITVISHVIFCVSAVFFLALLLFASTVARGY